MPDRPLITHTPEEKAPRIDLEDIWRSAQRRNAVETFEEQEVFSLSPAEADKCRFEMSNPSLRLAECTVHVGKFTHGVRLHPPHLWNIDPKGKLLKRKDQNSAWEYMRPPTIDK